MARPSLVATWIPLVIQELWPLIYKKWYIACPTHWLNHPLTNHLLNAAINDEDHNVTAIITMITVLVYLKTMALTLLDILDKSPSLHINEDMLCRCLGLFICLFVCVCSLRILFDAEIFDRERLLGQNRWLRFSWIFLSGLPSLRTSRQSNLFIETNTDTKYLDVIP